MCTRNGFAALEPLWSTVDITSRGAEPSTARKARSRGLGEHVAHAVGERAARRPADRVAQQVVGDAGRCGRRRRTRSARAPSSTTSPASETTTSTTSRNGRGAPLERLKARPGIVSGAHSAATASAASSTWSQSVRASPPSILHGLAALRGGDEAAEARDARARGALLLAGPEERRRPHRAPLEPDRAPRSARRRARPRASPRRRGSSGRSRPPRAARRPSAWS